MRLPSIERMAPLDDHPGFEIRDERPGSRAASALSDEPVPTFRADARATRLRALAIRLLRETDGATMIEYSLLTAVMAGAVIACMTLFGTAMKGMFDSIVQYYTLAK